MENKKVIMKAIQYVVIEFNRLFKEEKGLTMVEYAVVGALIVAAAVGAFTTLGSNMTSKIDFIASQIQ